MTGADSAGANGGHVAGRPTILRLCVGDGAVLLPQMQPQLALVSEVQVTFFTLQRRAKPQVRRSAFAGASVRDRGRGLTWYGFSPV